MFSRLSALAMHCMALIQVGAGVTDIRGSIGGTTYSRSAAGLIARARRKGVNPNTPAQTSARARVSLLAEAWNSTLTAQQRADWRDYAAGTPGTNKLGQTITLSGLNMFIAVNAIRRECALALVAAAPLELGMAVSTPLVFTASAATQQITLADPVSGWDKDTDDDYLRVAYALPQQGGRVGNPKGFKGFWVFPGDSVGPVAFPFAADYPHTFVEGQRLHLRAVHLDANNRISSPTVASCIAGA